MKIQYLILTATTALFVGKAIAGTAGDADVADSCGTGCSYTISADGKTLTITGTGANAYIANAAFSPRYDANGTNISDINNYDTRFSAVENVIITGSISTVGRYAFRDSNLASVTISDSVTEIAAGAFHGNNLTSVTIPDSVTEIKLQAFNNNSNLSSIIIEGTTPVSTGFGNIASDAILYCPNGHTACTGSVSHVVYYEKEGDLYKIGDSSYAIDDLTSGENNQVIWDNYRQFLGVNSDSIIIDYDASQKIKYIKALKAAAGLSLTEARDAVNANIIGDKLILKPGEYGRTTSEFTQAFADFNYTIQTQKKELRRIYTLEEAQARIKEIGKDHVTFRIRYK